MAINYKNRFTQELVQMAKKMNNKKALAELENRYKHVLTDVKSKCSERSPNLDFNKIYRYSVNLTVNRYIYDENNDDFEQLLTEIMESVVRAQSYEVHHLT